MRVNTQKKNMFSQCISAPKKGHLDCMIITPGIFNSNVETNNRCSFPRVEKRSGIKMVPSTYRTEC